MTQKFVVDAGGNGWRLDKFLASKFSNLSRSKISFLIKNSQVRVDAGLKKSSYLLKEGEKVSIFIPAEESNLDPYNLSIPIIWEDDYLLVVNKPTGLVVHPHGKNKNKTLVNALLGMKKKLASSDKQRPGVVHRLDKETSGIMVLAKNNTAYLSLVKQFKERKIIKEYRTLVWGLPKTNRFEIKLPLKRKEKNRLKMEVKLFASKTALTTVEALQLFENKAYLAVFPETGRMHQIRVHLSFSGLPVIGDKKYGKKDSYQRLLLHAYKIKVNHPLKEIPLEFKAPLPEDFMKILKKINLEN